MQCKLLEVIIEPDFELKNTQGINIQTEPKMVIENQPEVQTITLNGVSYALNIREIETFMQQCDLFMDANQNDFDTMTQVIADQLIDNANANTSVPELRAQLKFLREVSFLLRCMMTPATPSSNY